MKRVALLSGGRDSTCMVLRLLEKGIDLDYILFTDTLNEFNLMYEYLERVNSYLKKTYSKSIIYTKPKTTFEHWVFGKVTRNKNKGKIRGLPKISNPCYWKRESKTYPKEDFLKQHDLTTENSIIYVGYTYSELSRIPKNSKNQRYPLVEWKFCESDVDNYLKKINLENPLYKNFFRTGCHFCPNLNKAISPYILTTLKLGLI